MLPPRGVAIVGAGAAGLATAIFAKRGNPDLDVLLLESARSPGAKILVSGGGRCNVTNRDVAADDYWQPRSACVRRVLRALPVPATLAFFAELGVSLHEERDGKLFPDTQRSRSVLDALLAEARGLGVELQCGARVATVTRRDGGFELELGARRVTAARVVLATGGRSLPKSGSDGHGYALAQALGHRLVATTPALAPLLLASGGFHAALSGVSLPVELELAIEDEPLRRIRGDLLFTHFGISGPAALDASRFWHRAALLGRRCRAALNLLPGRDFSSVEAQWLAQARERPTLSAGRWLGSWLPQVVADAVLAQCGLATATTLARVARESRRAAIRALLGWPLAITGSRGYNFAEATSGGVPLEEVQAGTLGSRVCPGLYLAGELLDVDGRLGGFNFQWAWASGFVVGRALANAPTLGP